jgi:DNA-binding MarR family transcriptional regulator
MKLSKGKDEAVATDSETTIDTSPVFEQDPLDLRLTVAALVHWADSREVREETMRRVGFPVRDIPMFLVVNQLTYRGALRPTDLASTLGTGKANMSKIVRRLEVAGLVTRIASTSDERSILVALTREGRDIGERIMAAVDSQYQAVIAGWSEHEITQLQQLLGRFARHAVYEMTYRSPALHSPSGSAFPLQKIL